MTHFSRIPCPRCKVDAVFHDRRCIACGYEMVNAAERKYESKWDTQQQRRIRQLKGVKQS